LPRAKSSGKVGGYGERVPISAHGPQGWGEKRAKGSGSTCRRGDSAQPYRRFKPQLKGFVARTLEDGGSPGGKDKLENLVSCEADKKQISGVKKNTNSSFSTGPLPPKKKTDPVITSRSAPKVIRDVHLTINGKKGNQARLQKNFKGGRRSTEKRSEGGKRDGSKGEVEHLAIHSVLEGGTWGPCHTEMKKDPLEVYRRWVRSTPKTREPAETRR